MDAGRLKKGDAHEPREAPGLSTLRSNATEDGRRVHRRFRSDSQTVVPYSYQLVAVFT